MSAPAKARVGILISGGGSNMAALIAAAQASNYPAEIVTVISNRPGAGGLAKAAAAGVPTVTIDHKGFADRESFEVEVDAALRAAGVEIVCLAGFMRLLTPWFIERWQNRMINVHPALLPSYKGLHTHARALADGVKLHGATVHFVRPEMDVGPIIAQGAVPVFSDDTPEMLAARVLTVEHRIYPLALRLLAAGRLRIEDERVIVDGEADDGDALLAPRIALPG